jgi:hypothetical protein
LFCVKLSTAQPNGIQKHDTLYFIKKSNPEQSIAFPIDAFEVDVYWKNGENDRAYIVNIENNLIELRIYADDEEDRFDRKMTKKAIKHDNSLSEREKKMKAHKVDFQTYRTAQLDHINKIVISNRDLTGTPIAQALFASDVTIITTVIATKFINFIPYVENYATPILLGVFLLDGVAVLTEIFFTKSFIRTNEWAIGRN